MVWNLIVLGTPEFLFFFSQVVILRPQPGLLQPGVNIFRCWYIWVDMFEYIPAYINVLFI